jgi:hypothetical protein
MIIAKQDDKDIAYFLAVCFRFVGKLIGAGAAD